jgi:hypothetical protein
MLTPRLSEANHADDQVSTFFTEAIVDFDSAVGMRCEQTVSQAPWTWCYVVRIGILTHSVYQEVGDDDGEEH